MRRRAHAVMAGILLALAGVPMAGAAPAAVRVDTPTALVAEGEVGLRAYDPEILLDGGDLSLRAHGGTVEVRIVEVRESTGARDVRRVTLEAPSELRILQSGHGFHALFTRGGVGTLTADVSTAKAAIRHSDAETTPSVPTLRAREAGYAREGLAGQVHTWATDGHKVRAFTNGPLKATLAGSFEVFLYDAEAMLIHPHESIPVTTGTSREKQEGVHGALGKTEWVTRYAFLTWTASHGELEATPRNAWVRAPTFPFTVEGHVLASDGTTRFTSGGDQHTGEHGGAFLTGTFSGMATPVEKDRVAGELEGEVAFARIATLERDFGAGRTAAAAGLGILSLLGAGAAFYSRFRRAQVLRHAERERAYTLVTGRPGLDVKEIARELGLSWSNAAYHLRVLEREGFVTARRAGRHRVYFPVGGHDEATQRAHIVLRHGVASRLFDAVRETPGVIQKDLADRLGIPPSTVCYHLSRLVGAGLLEEERAWREKRYFARA